jgi:hypothetical protein
MNKTDLIKPSTFKVIVGIIISGALLMTLFLFNIPFIPCMSMPLVNPELNLSFKSSMCALIDPVGITTEFYWLSYVGIILMFIILPYAIACLVEYLLVYKF